MAKTQTSPVLYVYMNGRRVGTLERTGRGLPAFTYHQDWIDWKFAIPISLALPVRETSFAGEPVRRFFGNLLPDSEQVRRQVAVRVGAKSPDFYDLLEKIGVDCVGALQIIPENDVPSVCSRPAGVAVNEEEIEKIITSLAFAPLGNAQGQGFRISLAGAQEKTALTLMSTGWYVPSATTPTTHILKPQIGTWMTADGVVDMSQSVENEFYCMKLMAAFGMPTADVEIADFGTQRVLIVKRFDRQHTSDGGIVRLPQEDLCQALGYGQDEKYQSSGGPSAIEILKLLQASDTPELDRRLFFKSLILFWLIGATDGHAKNFSVFLRPGGQFQLAPLYDVLSLQHGFDSKQIRHKDFQVAMSAGKSGYYRIDSITGRHFRETASAAGLTATMIQSVFEDLADGFKAAFDKTNNSLPTEFPKMLPTIIERAATHRLKLLSA